MISLRDVFTGFGNRDPLAEVWRRSLRGGGGGSTVITGVPPLRYIGYGRPLTDYLISGNTLQDGTPSPDAPVDAVGCGVRTGNLFDYKSVYAPYVDENGDISAAMPKIGAWNYFTADDVGKTLTIRAYVKSVDASYVRIQGNINGSSVSSNQIKAGNTGYVEITVIVASTSDSWRFTYGAGIVNVKINQVMLNLGSTALPYVPYGFKLPLTVNGVEYPIYLGTVPTTRRVKKLVLTGDDGTWQKSNTRTGSFFLRLGNVAIPGFGLCDRAVNAQNAGEYSSSGKMLIERSGSNILINMWLFDTDISVDDFKSYLASQYAAGTPVTVWYVLAEPETAVINEPLMKIGDYADTVSAAQAGVTIPTIDGENILDVPTEVPPSEITIKGGIISV